MKLRNYQVEAFNKIIKSIETGEKRIVLQLPTGTGKTEVAVEIIKHYLEQGKKICFFVDKLSLVDQASHRFDKYNIDHGVIQANHFKTDYSKPLQIASIQTFFKRPAWEFDLAIVDECHVVYKWMSELMSRWDNTPFIGLSATPFTKGLGNIYNKLIKVTSIKECIENGYLVDAEVYSHSKPDMTGAKISGGDYNQKDAAERSNKTKLVADIVETWHKLAENKQTLVYATNVLHSKHIVQQFIESGVNAVHIDAYTDTSECRKIIREFKKGNIKLLSSVGVLTTGFNAPAAFCGIIARPTKSLALHFQIVGRLIRPDKNKEKALILDHAGNYERLGFHDEETPDELNCQKKGEKNQERQKPLPKPCPKCSYVKPVKAAVCPSCGHECKPQLTVFHEEGELRRIDNINKKTSKEEKQKIYSMLLWYAERHGYSFGWVSHTYRDKFGVWPKGFSKSYSIEPDEETYRFIASKLDKFFNDDKTQKSVDQEKQEFYGGLLTYAKQKGFKDGWAAYKYKEKFGGWPNGLKKEPCEISASLQRYIDNQRVKYFKQQKQSA